MTKRFEAAALFLAGVAAFAFWALFATSVISPVVVDDEVRFLITAFAGPRLADAQAMGAAVQPSGALAYPALVRVLAPPGVGLETWAKLLNALLFTAAAGGLAWVAAPAGRRRSAWIAAAVLLAPVATYAAYVMPECLSFALVAAAALALVAGPGGEVARAGLTGALLGAATVVKPHGMLGVLALLVALTMAALLSRRLRTGALAVLAAAVGAAAAFLLIKALTTPSEMAGRDLLGPAYRAQLAALAAGPARWAAGLRLALTYLIAVLALLAPAAMVLATRLVDGRAEAWRGGEGAARRAGLWALLLLAGLVLAVPLVLAMEANQTHLRYIDFLFPIVLPLAARLGPEPSKPVLRAGAIVWAVAGLALAWEAGRLRPLASAAPDLFFLYGGREFGAFGLRDAARPFLVVAILAGAAAMASGRVRWTTAQGAVLVAFALVAIPNAWKFDRVLSGAMAADRAVGKAARLSCGPGALDVVAVGTPTDFVPVYASLTALRRPAPLVLSKLPAEVRAVLPAGACLITTLPTPEPRWEKLAESPLVRLYRAR